MYDGSSGFRLWANANKVKKESISIIDEGKVGLNSLSQDDEQDEDWAMVANVAAAGDWENAETTAEWGLNVWYKYSKKQLTSHLNCNTFTISRRNFCKILGGNQPIYTLRQNDTIRTLVKYNAIFHLVYNNVPFNALSTSI
jgi:hypothetical protein